MFFLKNEAFFGPRALIWLEKLLYIDFSTKFYAYRECAYSRNQSSFSLSASLPRNCNKVQGFLSLEGKDIISIWRHPWEARSLNDIFCFVSSCNSKYVARFNLYWSGLWGVMQSPSTCSTELSLLRILQNKKRKWKIDTCNKLLNKQKKEKSSESRNKTQICI